MFGVVARRISTDAVMTATLTVLCKTSTALRPFTSRRGSRLETGYLELTTARLYVTVELGVFCHTLTGICAEMVL